MLSISSVFPDERYQQGRGNRLSPVSFTQSGTWAIELFLATHEPYDCARDQQNKERYPEKGLSARFQLSFAGNCHLQNVQFYNQPACPQQPFIPGALVNLDDIFVIHDILLLEHPAAIGAVFRQIKRPPFFIVLLCAIAESIVHTAEEAVHEGHCRCASLDVLVDPGLVLFGEGTDREADTAVRSRI